MCNEKKGNKLFLHFCGLESYKYVDYLSLLLNQCTIKSTTVCIKEPTNI